MATLPRTKPTFAMISEEVLFRRRFERVKREELFAQLSAFMETRRTGRVTIDISQGGIGLLEMTETQTNFEKKTFSS